MKAKNPMWSEALLCGLLALCATSQVLALEAPSVLETSELDTEKTWETY